MNERVKNKNGFTLIELLVVIAIIGLLSSVVLASVNTARQKAYYARAQADLDQIRKAMRMYEIDVGELPPRGDSCPACCYPNCQTAWDAVMNALLVNDGSRWSGPYLRTAIPKDPWGHHYSYDDNACNSNCGDSNIGTAGADGIQGTGDDYWIRVTSLSEVQGCCY
ncbi:MAG: type II secretion system protein GspG [Candidatus Tagabacteria bacterium]